MKEDSTTGGTLGTKKYQVDLALKFWRLTHLAKRLGNIPPFRGMAGLIASEDSFKGSFVPIREEIEVPESVVAPRRVLEDYIRRASARTILRQCPCRSGEGCEKYPRDIGCIFLGEGSRDVDPSVGYPATAEEALAHMDRALDVGLLPLIGHFKVDKYAFGIRDYGKLLTICFCCECCCVVRSGMRNLVCAYPDSLVKLDGISVRVTDGCVGCSECVGVCPVENISMVGGRAVIGEACLGCGACVDACSRGFIEMTMDFSSPIDEEIRRRIEPGVEIE